MSVPITARLTALNHLNGPKLEDLGNGTYRLTADNKKQYKIVRIAEHKYSVTKDYQQRSKSFARRVAHFFAILFGCTTCQKLEKSLAKDDKPLKLAVTRKVAAGKIKKAMKTYLENKASAREKSAPNERFYTMTNPGRKAYNGGNLTFYFDKDEKLPTIRTPEKKQDIKAEPESSTLPHPTALPDPKMQTEAMPAIGGACKTLTGADSRYVALEFKQSATEQGTKNFNQVAESLRDLKYCHPGIAVNGKLILAHNAGKNLCQHAESNKISIRSFRGVCENLQQMHSKRMAHRDIKPDNLTMDSKGQVNLIDFDGAVIIGVTDRNYQAAGKKNVFITDQYTTKQLQRQIKQGTGQAFNDNDNYAMLLSMIVATDNQLAGLTNIKYMPDPSVFYDVRDRSRLEAWIKTNVKSEYQEKVYNFMRNPAVNRLPTSIFNLIQWPE